MELWDKFRTSVPVGSSSVAVHISFTEGRSRACAVIGPNEYLYNFQMFFLSNSSFCFIFPEVVVSWFSESPISLHLLSQFDIDILNFPVALDKNRGLYPR